MYCRSETPGVFGLKPAGTFSHLFFQPPKSAKMTKGATTPVMEIPPHPKEVIDLLSDTSSSSGEDDKEEELEEKKTEAVEGMDVEQKATTPAAFTATTTMTMMTTDTAISRLICYEDIEREREREIERKAALPTMRSILDNYMRNSLMRKTIIPNPHLSKTSFARFNQMMKNVRETDLCGIIGRGTVIVVGCTCGHCQTHEYDPLGNAFDIFHSRCPSHSEKNIISYPMKSSRVPCLIKNINDDDDDYTADFSNSERDEGQQHQQQQQHPSPLSSDTSSSGISSEESGRNTTTKAKSITLSSSYSQPVGVVSFQHQSYDYFSKVALNYYDINPLYKVIEDDQEFPDPMKLFLANTNDERSKTYRTYFGSTKKLPYCRTEGITLLKGLGKHGTPIYIFCPEQLEKTFLELDPWFWKPTSPKSHVFANAPEFTNDVLSGACYAHPKPYLDNKSVDVRHMVYYGDFRPKTDWCTTDKRDEKTVTFVYVKASGHNLNPPKDKRFVKIPNHLWKVGNPELFILKQLNTMIRPPETESMRMKNDDEVSNKSRQTNRKRKTPEPDSRSSSRRVEDELKTQDTQPLHYRQQQQQQIVEPLRQETVVTVEEEEEENASKDITPSNKRIKLSHPPPVHTDDTSLLELMKTLLSEVQSVKGRLAKVESLLSDTNDDKNSLPPTPAAQRESPSDISCNNSLTTAPSPPQIPPKPVPSTPIFTPTLPIPVQHLNFQDLKGILTKVTGSQEGERKTYKGLEKDDDDDNQQTTNFAHNSQTVTNDLPHSYTNSSSSNSSRNNNNKNQDDVSDDINDGNDEEEEEEEEEENPYAGFYMHTIGQPTPSQVVKNKNNTKNTNNKTNESMKPTSKTTPKTFNKTFNLLTPSKFTATKRTIKGKKMNNNNNNNENPNKTNINLLWNR